jgi:hypothetical protein
MKYLLCSIFTVATVLFSPHLFSQIRYEKGYFIDNENIRTECLIKNLDWPHNPKLFDYKLNDQANSNRLTIDSVKEFGVYDNSKFVRAEVEIDRSPDAIDIDKLSESPLPLWSKETLFLKVQVQGDATLFSYEEEKLLRFFYQVANGNIIQLIYKPYLVNESAFNYNTGFRDQLLADVNCGNISSEKTEYLSYDQDVLIKYFKNYNACKGGVETYAVKKIKRKSFSFKIMAGINYSSLTTGYPPPSINPNNTITFTPKINVIGGFEAEYILPYNRNKWSIIFDPNYFSYSSSGEKGQLGNGTVNYSAIAIAAGVREGFFLKNNVKLFANCLVSYNVKTSGNYFDFYNSENIRHSLNVGLGAGIAYNKLSAELRYYTSADIFKSIGFYGSFKRASLTFKYEFF